MEPGAEVDLPSAWRFKLDAETGIEFLRVGIGIVWALNMIFIVLPSAQYFPTFHDVAAGYGPITLGGPGISNYVAAHSVFFAWLIAIATGYLAVAFILGVTTRLAIVVGLVASVFFFVTQFWMTFMFPGGTDVGAHPLYLLIYLGLLLGGAGRKYSVDQLISQKLSSPPRWAPTWLHTHPFALVGTYLPKETSTGAEASKWRPSGPRVTRVLTVVMIAALVGGVAFTIGYGLGLGPGGNNPGMSSGASGPYYVDLAINEIAYHNGSAQQCTPANFTVPANTLLIFVIKNYYTGEHAVSPPYGTVKGTVGSVEYLNGSLTGVGSVPAHQVSETFSIMQGGNFPGFNAPIPAAGLTPSIVQFSAYFNETGPETWMTMAPTDAHSMMTPGLMMGMMTVV